MHSSSITSELSHRFYATYGRELLKDLKVSDHKMFISTD